MKSLMIVLTVMIALTAAPLGAEAHCDAIDGPVATAAVKALDAKNVNLILPYAPAEAEGELTAAYAQALTVRAQGAEAKALADRWFMETAVRLHRAGEKAAYTGLKPAGLDHGPAIPAAERAVESGTVEALLAFLSREVGHGVIHRFEQVAAHKAAPAAPATRAEVAAARERVSAELGFVTYVEGLYQATKGGAHAE